MNDQEIAIARRAVACPKWRWMPGMLQIFAPGTVTDGVVCGRVTGSGEWGRPMLPSVMGAIPDLTDPATLGCIEHGLLPAGWWLVPVVRGLGEVGAWVVYRYVDRADGRPMPVSRPCPTKGEALIAALEAA
jgi:hypothetical protein